MKAQLKTTTAIWTNEHGNVLFKELLFCVDLPAEKTFFIWTHHLYQVVGVTQNFDTGETTIDVEAR